jgi:hypothetical protein
VSLSLLKVGMLGCVAMDVAPPYGTVLGEINSGCLIPGFPWWDGLSGVGRLSEVLPPGGALGVVARLFCPQGKLEGLQIHSVQIGSGTAGRR